jgi:transcriptional regulator with XRE-family HTH domain
MSLLESTQQMLDRQTSRGVSLREIAEKSGGKVKYEWLKKFAQGGIENPGVNTIEELHKTLRDLNS